MTGLLTVAYAGLVLLATQVFGFHTPVAVAASALTAAALFDLPRRRVQRAVNRRFHRLAVLSVIAPKVDGYQNMLKKSATPDATGRTPVTAAVNSA